MHIGLGSLLKEARCQQFRIGHQDLQCKWGHISGYESDNSDILFKTAYTFNGDMDRSLRCHLTVTGSYGIYLQLCLR